MSKPKMHQFMGSKEDQKEKPVHITYDPSVIRKKSRTTSNNQEEIKNEKVGNDLSNMSLAASLGKDERIFKMLVEYDKGNLVTITSVAKYLNVSYATAKKYAKEADICIFDDAAKKYTEGRMPKSMS